MGILSSLFGKKKSVDFAELISQGAQIIDVRTPSEYSNGHLKASKNIPLDRLASSVSKIDKKKPVITCCASGMRSSSARGILIKAGFTEVYNGGPWTSLRSYTK
jgi:rhodanese-related sulfurtransferase